MMKLKYITHTLIIVIFFLVGCGGCGRGDKSGLKGHLIPEQTAIDFRIDFLEFPDSDYHVPEAFMFDKSTFIDLFHMSGIDAIRLYPAINKHGDDAADSLTFIMVPVNSSDQKDNFSGHLYEFAKLCPTVCNCAGNGSYSAQTEDSMDYIIPTSWCISKKTIEDIITAAEATGDVHGIRFYIQKTSEGIMDLTIIATRAKEGYYEDIGEVRIENAAKACLDGEGSCDPDSKLYHPTSKGK